MTGGRDWRRGGRDRARTRAAVRGPAVARSLIAGLVLSGCACAGAGRERDRDGRALQGSWRVTSMQGGGRKMPQDYSRHFTYTFKGDTVRFLGDEFTPGADLTLTFTLDLAAAPRRIDMTLTAAPDGKGLGKVSHGIYRIAGDTLELCYSDKGQPAEFKTAEGDDNSLITLVREP